MDFSILNGDAENFLRSLGNLSSLDGIATAALLATAILALLLKTLSFVPIALGACYLLMGRYRKGLIFLVLALVVPWVVAAVASGGNYFNLWVWLLAAVSYPGYWASKRLSRKVSGWKKIPEDGDPGAATLLWSAFRRPSRL